ncbi:MAG TPA: 2,3-bisphosphoglycerate-independent phosphoglycerate mutase [Candidatus Omnitrophota bacterium]|mgnify:CR=1 FL=1|jgi:2,3-bisphosphoglycerate-independent phosphoglycerate mutase|nr:MAG: cofactor-independent phosphoglycerate mutase [Candidatus Omnitrophica bacterium ADurb.Bin314]HOE68556.1 2,3-bisphosphoglycerate-independent phosphoglycerate mutase [Candidatus Omnitrophota bacterium]HQB93582.1 2,3-bisphosphoglycerate-independent phosphoglycerate mutase [Candidatus Omnitrophota bacterium]
MKYIVVALSGAADHPTDDLGGKTPLEVAKIPHLSFFAKSGKVGTAKVLPDRAPLAPDAGLFGLLGYEGKLYPGRGPLEAANLELMLEDNEVAFCMNFITESAGLLADATAGNIGTKEAKALINFLNKKVSSDFVRFFSGTAHRHIAVIKDAHGFEALSARSNDPENVLGQKIEHVLPKGPGEELLKKLMFDARLLLQDHEINQVRVDLGENPANMIWLWGQGKKPALKPIRELYDLTGGAMVASREYAKGLGRMAGLTVMELKEDGEDPAVFYDRISKVALDALEEKDFICLHLHQPDEASRAGDLKAKVSALEAIDYFILSKLRKYCERQKESRLLVTPCHATLWKMRSMVSDHAPFVIFGKNVMADEVERFSEVAATTSELRIQKNTELMPFFITKAS